jgi:hypothetical protein
MEDAEGIFLPQRHREHGGIRKSENPCPKILIRFRNSVFSVSLWCHNLLCALFLPLALSTNFQLLLVACGEMV